MEHPFQRGLGIALQLPAEVMHDHLCIILEDEMVFFFLLKDLTEIIIIHKIAIEAERKPFPEPAMMPFEGLGIHALILSKSRISYVAYTFGPTIPSEDCQALVFVACLEPLIDCPDIPMGIQDLPSCVRKCGESSAQLSPVLKIKKQLIKVEEGLVFIPVLWK